MASRRVIQDSDDDDEAISPANSPRVDNNMSLTEHTANPKPTQSNPAATSSTDPVLFQNLYDNQQRAALQETPPDFTNSAQLPVLGDQIINQPMSSSPISVRRLKRSRTVNPSSLTLITSPHELQHKAKRTKPSKDMDDLTQLTSPEKQNQQAKPDVWEFTGSSDPKPGPLKLGRLGKENVTKEKKSYGKLRRSKTIAHNRSSQSDTWDYEQGITRGSNLVSAEKESSGQTTAELGKSMATKEKKTYGKLKRAKTLTNLYSSQSEVQEHDKSSSKDDSHGFGRKRRASIIESFDMALVAPKVKKQKHDLHGTQADGENARGFVGVMKGSLDADADTERRSSSESTGIQVPRTANEKDAKPAKSFDLTFGDDSSIITSPRLRIPPAKDDRVSLSVEDSTNSISIVPATLTDSQKMTYENVSVVSTNQERRSSITEMVSVPGQSSTVSKATPQLDHYSQGVNAPIERLSSSPPIVTTSSKMKRARSLSRVEATLATSQAPASSTTSVTSMVVPKMRRSKTMTSGRTPQSSIDELSYTKSQELGKSLVTKAVSKEARKKTKKQPEERVNADELSGSDEVGLPRELYQPRPSRRRSKSMSTVPTADLSALPPLTRKNSTRAAKVTPEFANGEASIQHSNTFVGSVENDELAPTRRTVDLSGNEGDQPTANIADTMDFQTDETLPKTISMNGSKEIDMPDADNVVEISPISVSKVVSKRRGRPPNVPATVHTVEKIAKDITENPGLLGGPLESIEAPTEPTPRAVAPTKRRGRPPKSSEKVVEATKEVEIISNEDTLVERVPMDAANALQEEHHDVHSASHGNEPSWSKPADFLLPKSTPPQPAEHSTALPLVTPTKSIKKGPDHSPLPSSKVPYRVGLSKRTRIAPLLKMIKK